MRRRMYRTSRSRRARRGRSRRRGRMARFIKRGGIRMN